MPCKYKNACVQQDYVKINVPIVQNINDIQRSIAKLWLTHGGTSHYLSQ